ncbi:MAG: DNA integrity scanning protein DisA nucleotide-binding domain protein, partial [Desulfohalobiaceae bacterium]|nr:DNA integrity scanning protein DisA nucleotide-binding domain protein [Desulfohalobiaceae bacterium]
FHATTRRAKMVQLEEALLEIDFDQEIRHLLFQAVTRIVHKAQERKHGCTLVLDFNHPPLGLIGQSMTGPLDMSDEKMLELAMDLAKMDGALHIDKRLHLLGFGCLLDGHRVSWEDSSRGARYNSALRFTAENEKIIVVVVSSDQPVSIIQGGIDIKAACEWEPVHQDFQPPTLRGWLEDIQA